MLRMPSDFAGNSRMVDRYFIQSRTRALDAIMDEKHSKLDHLPLPAQLLGEELVRDRA